MKPVERLHAAVNFEAYDRPPFVDQGWTDVDTVPHFSGCAARKDRKYSESDRARAIQAAMDAIPYGSVYETKYPVLGESSHPEKDGDVIVRDGIHYVVYGFTEWVKERPFSDAEGFADYLEKRTDQVRKSSPRLPSDFEEKLEYARKMLGDTVIGYPLVTVCLDRLYPIAGWDILATIIVEKPEVIAEYLSAEADLSVKRIHMDAEYFRECPFVLVYSDIAYHNGLLLSPDFLGMALMPALRKITLAFHEHDIKVIYHSEGDLRKIIDDLTEAGCDGINPLAPSDNMDAVDIRRKYPDLILWGGIDNTTVLHSGTPDEVTLEVERMVNGVGRGLILGSSGGVDPGCRLSNCTAMVAALRKIAG